MRLKQTEPRKVTIDGREYWITPFPAFQAANISGELSGVIAPLFAALVPIIKTMKNGLDTDLKDINLAEAATALSKAAVSGDQVESTMRKLLLGGHIATKLEDDNGRLQAVRLDEDIVNELFCGDILTMFMLCYQVIATNFNGFFKKLASQSGQVSEEEVPVRTIY